jgi:hypothetical protein
LLGLVFALGGFQHTGIDPRNIWALALKQFGQRQDLQARVFAAGFAAAVGVPGAGLAALASFLPKIAFLMLLKTSIVSLPKCQL